MTKIDREALSKRIVQFFLAQTSNAKQNCVQHFREEGVSRSTVYFVIARYEKTGSYVDLPRPGRPPKMNKEKVKRLRKMVNNKDGISQSRLGNFFGVTQQTISNVLKSKTEIHRYKKEKAPARTDAQKIKAVKRAGKLAYHKFVGKDIVMDDEKYFHLSNTRIPGNDSYYTDDKSKTPDNVKYKLIDRNEQKVLVWVAISSKGFSDIYVHKSKNSINRFTYIKECLDKRLKPFLSTHHADGNYVFWADLATAHTANDTIEWLEVNNIPYVSKSENPPKVPKARPIEDFWGILSSNVYSEGWQAKTIHQLIIRIKRQFKLLIENDENLAHKLLQGTKSKLRKIAKEGVYAIN